MNRQCSDGRQKSVALMGPRRESARRGNKEKGDRPRGHKGRLWRTHSFTHSRSIKARAKSDVKYSFGAPLSQVFLNRRYGLGGNSTPDKNVQLQFNSNSLSNRIIFVSLLLSSAESSVRPPHLGPRPSGAPPPRFFRSRPSISLRRLAPEMLMIVK